MDVDASFFQSNISDACAKNQSTEACSEIGNNVANEMAEGSLSENYSSLKPDFSILEGEICLDNFSVRELQEAFRATFGRNTSVRDKLWLKRRIAMGLTNSCDIPSTKFSIKDNKIVISNVKQEITSKTQSSMSYPGFITMNKSTDLLNKTSEETLSVTSSRIEGQQASFTEGPEGSIEKCNEDNVNTQKEQCGAKRIRKPTKRYVEEHSDSVVMECSGRVASFGKNAIHDRRSLKSKVSTPCLVDASVDLLGRFDARIPSVLRVRRRPRRKNFLALVVCIVINVLRLYLNAIPYLINTASSCQVFINALYSENLTILCIHLPNNTSRSVCYVLRTSSACFYCSYVHHSLL